MDAGRRCDRKLDLEIARKECADFLLEELEDLVVSFPGPVNRDANPHSVSVLREHGI